MIRKMKLEEVKRGGWREKQEKRDGDIETEGCEDEERWSTSRGQDGGIDGGYVSH